VAVATSSVIVMLVALDAVPVREAVMVPAEKFPEASRATIAKPVFRLVALLVIVIVRLVLWLAVNVGVAEIERPAPDTPTVRVASFTVGISEVSATVPVVAGSVSTVPVPATALGRS
jgi:multisubunit Na+/H+ antiporter MnhB subunit